MNVRRMLHYGFIHLLLACGIFVQGQSAEAFTLPEGAVMYMAGLKQLGSCRASFRQLMKLRVNSLYIQEFKCKRKV
jgi:hypothetical protein